MTDANTKSEESMFSKLKRVLQRVIRLAIRVARADAEIALAELLELAPAGVEEVDHGDTIEYAVYGAEGELPSLPDLRAAAGAALVEVTTTEVADDWASRWRDFHVPVTIGGRLHVRPPWCDPPARRGRARCSTSSSTPARRSAPARTPRRGCAWSCCSSSREPTGALVDLGCGSGVLAIAAAKLGWGPVLGLDHEHAAVRAARENARANGVRVDVRHGDLLHDGAPAPGAPTVVANLLRPLLAHVARVGFAGAQPPRVLIVSGLLRAEADDDRRGVRARAGPARARPPRARRVGGADARRPERPAERNFLRRNVRRFTVGTCAMRPCSW